jgi:hypothetical protein
VSLTPELLNNLVARVAHSEQVKVFACPRPHLDHQFCDHCMVDLQVADVPVVIHAHALAPERSMRMICGTENICVKCNSAPALRQLTEFSNRRRGMFGNSQFATSCLRLRGVCAIGLSTCAKVSYWRYQHLRSRGQALALRHTTPSTSRLAANTAARGPEYLQTVCASPSSAEMSTRARLRKPFAPSLLEKFRKVDAMAIQHLLPGRRGTRT